MERDVFLYRSLIGQRKYGVVQSEIKSSAPAPLQALKLLAKYFQSPQSAKYWNAYLSRCNDLSIYICIYQCRALLPISLPDCQSAADGLTNLK